MAGNGKKRLQKVGLPPGTLIYTGERVEEKAIITIINFDEENYQEKRVETLAECPLVKDEPGVTWINVDGISHIPNLETLGSCFGLHPLVQEDILNIKSRPKIEDYETYLYIIVKSINYIEKDDEIEPSQISIILGSNYVLSFHERNGDIFQAIRERLKAAKGRLRKGGADYLAYVLLDLVVDNYFLVLEEFGEKIEYLEDAVVRQPGPQVLKDIHHFKNDMILLRKAMWPLREVLARLERRESPLITGATSVYFKDVYDHAVISIDTVETYRDILAGMLDIYLSSVSNRLNEIMKVLTIIATIFMPLTFLAGVYGMNFEYLPELKWRYGYFCVLGVMAAVALLMLVYFRKRKWI